MTIGGLLGRLIPESPARTLGEQLRLVADWRRYVDQLPEHQPANDPHNPPDPH